MSSTFLERWLIAHDVPPAQVAAAAEGVRARASRFPFPVSRAFKTAESFVDRVAPALLLRRACPAHALDLDEFDALERALQHHQSPYVRALFTLLRFPALEAVYPDAGPAHTPTHPLQALAADNRLRQRHGAPFDVIVIGSGAGGAPVAWQLSRRGFRVAIVESGALLLAESTETALETRYLDQGMTGGIKGQGMVLTLAGNAVGGTTVVNSGTSLRPRTERLATWDAALGTGFATGALDPFLDAACAQVGVRVNDRSLLSDSAAVVERGLAALGRTGSYVLPRNAPDCRGAGRCCFGCPNGAKLSTDRSFLPEALEHGATLFAQTRASRIRETDGGVEVFVDGPTGRRLLRGQHVVIAAGALSTPALLRQNKLGDRWRDAGSHLRMHPASKVFALMPEALRHGGVPQGLGYHDPALPRITFEGVHTPAAAAAPMVAAAGRRHRWWMERYDRLATFGMMCRDRATGRVQRVGSARKVDYALDPQDARDLGQGLLIAAEAFFAAGAERVLLPVSGMEPEVESIDALRRIRPEDMTPARLTTCGFHVQGTAGMGRIVDNSLRVLGSERTWVCDASVLPDSPGVNPQITIMALSLRCADALSDALSHDPSTKRGEPWGSAFERPCPDTTSSRPDKGPPDGTRSPSASSGAPTASSTG